MGKKEVTSKDLQRLIEEEIKLVIVEEREKILKRAHKKLAELTRG